MFKYRSCKAFTLLECLAALLVISGSLLVYQGLTLSINQHLQQMGTSDQDKWLLFSQQLRSELEGPQLDRVASGKLYVTKDKQALAFGLSKAGDLRKTNADGRGYQPMLFDLESAQFHQEGDLVTLQLRFKTGLERTFLYDF
ncbi:competence type IV pilus minor pilin ComGF [Streptococcus caprae]|uniref:Competence type IV pilus minor pilin ComGF n=1 Tax=Streptococcus caprae TaxID=1640501 RepID=A0ABV8CW34_9STRE